MAKSLSYYTPRKPAPSLPLATNLGIARENILPFYFLQYFQRSSNTNFCSLTASLSFITYDSETSTEEGNALVLSILDIPLALRRLLWDTPAAAAALSQVLRL